MTKEELEKLRFPTGRFQMKQSYSSQEVNEFVHTIDLLPQKLRAAVKNLDDQQLDTLYREGGWTVRQVVHHLADSHMNSYIRFKLAMTEETPTIRPYHEELWAELQEARHAPVEVSLSLLEALHRRWVLFLNSFSEDDWKKNFHHPESKRDWELSAVAALYAWHCNHHLAHITSLAERNGWNKN